MNAKLTWGLLVTAWAMAGSPAGDLVAAWNFNGITDTNAPSPAVGRGSATLVGGVDAVVAGGSGSSDPEPAATDGAWNLAGFPARTDVSALAGAEFRVDTSGFRDVRIQCDLRPSNTASRRLRFQYSTDGTEFVDGPVMVLETGGVFTNGLGLDLAGVAGAGNNPRFALRVVSVPDDSGEFVAVSGRYSPAGTWRLDMVQVLGIPLGGGDPGPPRPSGPPPVWFTNLLSGWVRPGEAPTNTFTDLAVQPGEQLEIRWGAGEAPGSGFRTRFEVRGDPPPGSGWRDLPPDEVGAGMASARFVLAPTEAERGRLFEVEAIAANGAGTNRVAWRVHVPTAAQGLLVLTEFLANPTGNVGSPAFNPLRRDPPSAKPGQHDEYLELVNFGSGTLDLGGWRLRDATGWRHVFREGTRIGASNVLILHGGAISGPDPGLDVPSVPAGEGIVGLSLNNDGDQLALYDASTNLVFRVVYTAEMMAGAAGGSLSRLPERDGAFAAQVAVSTLAVSPGRRVDGSRFDEGGAPESPPVPVRVMAHRKGSGGVELRWPASPTVTYAVWMSERLASGPVTWMEMARDLVFPDGEGRHALPIEDAVPLRLFRVGAR